MFDIESFVTVDDTLLDATTIQEHRRAILRQYNDTGRLSRRSASDKRTVFDIYTFGIELEGLSPICPNALGKELTAKGVSVVIDSCTTTTYSGSWKITSDSSISVPFTGRSESCVDCDGYCDECESKGDTHDIYGIEIVSPPLKGQKGIEDIIKVFSVLEDIQWATDSSCGLHIHVGAERFTNVMQFRDLIRLMYLAEIEIIKMQTPDRAGKDYCAPLDIDFVKDLAVLSDTAITSLGLDFLERIYYRSNYYDKNNKYCSARYRGLNLHSYWYRGTVEFRYFNSPTNGEECLANINLCLNIMATAEHGDASRVNISNYYRRQTDLEEPVLVDLFVDSVFKDALSKKKFHDRSLYGFALSTNRKQLLMYLRNLISNSTAGIHPVNVIN